MSSSRRPAERVPRQETTDAPRRATAGRSVCFVTETAAFGGTEVHTLGMIGVLLGRGCRIDLVECGHREYDDAIWRRGWGDRVTIIHTALRVGRAEHSRTEGPSLRAWKDLFAGVSRDALVFPKGKYRMGSTGFLRLCRRSFRKVFIFEHSEAEPVGPAVHRLHFGLIPGMGLWWYWWRWQQRARSRCADRIIAVSGQVRDRLVTEYAHAPARVVVGRNGVRWEELARDDALGAAFRARHGIPDATFVFGMITRLDHVKGVDLALRALDRVVAGAPARPVHLVVAGDGLDREQLEGLARALGVRDHVTFTGFVKEPKEALCAYDVILFPSRREGLPLALLEAMAAGCIPIVSRIGGMPEVVASPELGWVVPSEDPEALSHAMRSVLILDEAAVSQLRHNVTSRIQSEFDLGESHRRILEICGF